jgi:hypothetical protein
VKPVSRTNTDSSGSGSGNSSDTVPSRSTQPQKSLKPISSHPQAGSPSLKRKRADEQPNKAPIAETQGYVRLRQVPPVPRAATKQPTATSTLTASNSPVKLTKPLSFRKVAPPSKRPIPLPQSTEPSTSHLPSTSSIPPPQSSITHNSLSEAVHSPLRNVKADPAATQETHQPTEVTLVQLNNTLYESDEPPTEDAQSSPERTNSKSLSLDDSAGRRTRSGKIPTPTSDLFGGTTALKPRRRLTTTLAGADLNGPFATMSVTALRALTSTNTTRNQHYTAILETELVRRCGLRPESPQSKVRTLEERRKEEAQKGRRERAERRARLANGDEDAFYSDKDDEDEEFGPSEDGMPLRHRLGAGDEEEYVTPERARPSKRVRLDGADENGGNEEENRMREHERKRVKWDRGLFSTFYFDDAPKPLVVPKDAAVNKGALAGSAKVSFCYLFL